jgi:hypothetical protein
LDIFATTASSATILHFANFGVSRFGFSAVSLAIAALLLLFPERAKTWVLPSLCRAVCNRKSGRLLHFVSRGRSPLDFTAVNVISDTSITVHFRSTPMPTPYNTSTYSRLAIGMPDFALTLTLSTIPFKTAPQGGLVNLPVQPLPIVQIPYYFFVKPGQPVRSASATKHQNFIDIPYHLSQNYATTSKNFYLSSYPVVAQDTQPRA